MEELTIEELKLKLVQEMEAKQKVVGLIAGLGLHKVKSLYVLLAGALLAWLLNTDIDTRVFYLAPLFIGAGMFVDEILISPIYKKLVVTLKGDK